MLAMKESFSKSSLVESSENEDKFNVASDGSEIQKNELRRLLSTAKSKSRKDLLEKALSGLDTDRDKKFALSPSSSLSATNKYRSTFSANKSPSSLSFSSSSSSLKRTQPNDLTFSQQLLHSSQSSLHFGMKQHSKSPDSNPRTRPVSARLSRKNSFIPSNLDIIPENKWLNQSSADMENDVDLSVDDISSITSSCLDPRHHPKYSIRFFQIRPSSTTNASTLQARSNIGKIWIATGLVPQFLTLNFKERWLLRRLEVLAIGVESMTIEIDGARETKAMTKDDDNLFIFDMTALPHDDSHGGEVARKYFTLTITKASETFFGIRGMKIRALPFV